MIRRAWVLPRASVAIAALICVALSTQFLFQRSLYVEWSVREIGLAWLRGFGGLVVIAASILLALMLAGRLPARDIASKALLFVMATLAGASLGEWIVLWLEWGAWPAVSFEVLFPRALRWVPIGALMGAMVLVQQRTRETAARSHASVVTQLELEQQRVALQLQTLQSQIEPHFLFNTLATIRRLHQTDPPRGRKTLADFIRYLKSALPEMRARETTLGREVDLITAYLDVLRVRMGDRLHFEIEVPAALAEHRIPPLSLATLVENAIKHGLGALPEGGKLAIKAWIERDALVVRVADTGLGLTAAEGTGMGLANLRVRLRGLYGEAATLVLTPNVPRGVAAILRVPLPAEAHGRAGER